MAKLLFPYICSFLVYLYHMMLYVVNMKINVSGYKRIHFKVVNFIGLVKFKWHNKYKILVGPLVLRRICEKLCVCAGHLQQSDCRAVRES